jgi:exodeoxyribonuclease-3
MRIITLNANGIRAAHRKGFFVWMQHQQADVICLQETKAQRHQLPDEMLNPRGYQGFFNDAEKKGYSGVALYSRKRPERVSDELGWPRADEEGRFLHKQQREYIICGDWNIAHRKIDLKNWRGNQKNSGFLPEERAWMDELFGKTGLIDAFRVVNQKPDQYTWWSNRGQAWAKNVGWRIDYQVITPGLRDKVKSVNIYKKERFSDHAPLIIDYDIPF